MSIDQEGEKPIPERKWSMHLEEASSYGDGIFLCGCEKRSVNVVRLEK